MALISRRAFVFAASCLVPTTRLFVSQRGAQAPTITGAAFLRLSERLVGRQGLDAEVASSYLQALLRVPENGPRLARLALGNSARDAGDRALEGAILECWYTGTYLDGTERRVATHTGALMWSAVGVPPPATCAGVFGAWSQPPRNA